MGPWCGGLGWANWTHMGRWASLGIVGPFLGAAFIAAAAGFLALGAVWLGRRVSRPPVEDSRRERVPLDVARQRLAAGEITAAEFEEIQDRLRT